MFLKVPVAWGFHSSCHLMLQSSPYRKRKHKELTTTDRFNFFSLVGGYGNQRATCEKPNCQNGVPLRQRQFMNCPHSLPTTAAAFRRGNIFRWMKSLVMLAGRTLRTPRGWGAIVGCCPVVPIAALRRCISPAAASSQGCAAQICPPL